MATAFTHALVGAALTPLAPAELPRRVLVPTLALLAVLPDLDVAAFYLGIPYSHPLGHRGFSHSFIFAAVLAVGVGYAGFQGVRGSSAWAWWRLLAVLAMACASHGLLDAFTNAGLGVGFWIPFSNERFFFPWRPLETSPLGVSAFFDGPALRILANEFVWVWMPLVALFTLRLVWRARKGPSSG